MFYSYIDECYKIAEKLVDEFFRTYGADETQENIGRWHSWLLDGCDDDEMYTAMRRWIDEEEIFTTIEWVGMSAR